MIFSQADQQWMREALKEAKKAFERDEVPVGAVLVENDQIIASAHNCVEKSSDPTAHAELLVLRSAARKKGDWRLTNTVLYTTLEPCSMCAGALFSARIRRVVWAAPDLRQGANGSWVQLLEKPHPIHSIDVQGGLFAEEAGVLMSSFFQKQRKRECRIKD